MMVRIRVVRGSYLAILYLKYLQTVSVRLSDVQILRVLKVRVSHVTRTTHIFSWPYLHIILILMNKVFDYLLICLKKTVDELQTEKMLIRCSSLWHLIWVCTVCTCLSIQILNVYTVLFVYRNEFYFKRCVNSCKPLSNLTKRLGSVVQS